MYYIKVLKDGQACSGGTYAYDLPKQQWDGSWIPGRWHHHDGPVKLCTSGFHVTTAEHLTDWWQHGATAYCAEISNDIRNQYSFDKTVSPDIRLIRPLDTDELMFCRIYTEGDHTLVCDDDGDIAIDGARVKVSTGRPGYRCRVTVHLGEVLWKEDSSVLVFHRTGGSDRSADLERFTRRPYPEIELDYDCRLTVTKDVH